MNLMGYLVTLYNIQSFSETGGPLRDIAVRVSEVHRLADELRNLPEFPNEGFRETGFYRVRNVGKYLSNNLREYMYKGNVNPRDEGVILTLIFEDIPGYFANQKGIDGASTFYRPRAPVAFSDDDDNDDDTEAFSEVVGREKRAIPV